MADAILKTEGNISDERLDILAGIAERSCFTASGTTEVAKALRELQALRLSATASEKLLRDVGTDGRFSLSAVNSDEADAWYEARDAILKGKF